MGGQGSGKRKRLPDSTPETSSKAGSKPGSRAGSGEKRKRLLEPVAETSSQADAEGESEAGAQAGNETGTRAGGEAGREDGSESSSEVESEAEKYNNVTGLDFGSACSSMVITTKKGHCKEVDRYPNAPQTHGAAGDELKEVSSIVTIAKRGESIKYYYGYETARAEDTISTCKWLKLMIGMDDEDEKDAAVYMDLRKEYCDKLKQVNKTLKAKVTFAGLITLYLQCMHQHLEWWCKTSGETMPTATVATYPLRWKTKTIHDYQKLAENAGWENVIMRSEAEAALDAILADKPDTWFPKTVALGDCGGSTHDWVVAYVEKVGKVVTKEERMIHGGVGGMAIVIELAADLIKKKLDKSAKDNSAQDNAAKLNNYVDAFTLAMRSYVPKPNIESGEQDVGGLEFGNPRMLLTHNQMETIYEKAIWPIIQTGTQLLPKFEEHGVEEVFLVGGTSKSRRWFQPDIEYALQPLTITYPALPTSGATRAIDHNFVTKHRINRLHIGTMVSRDCEPDFTNKSIWGEPEDHQIEVIELVKPLGDLLTVDPDTAEWHWLQFEHYSTISALKTTLRETQIRIFATDKKAKQLHVLDHDDYNSVASRLDFDIEFESRRAFSQPEIKKILPVVLRTKRRYQYFYAIRFSDHPQGIRLEVGYQKDLTKKEEGIQTVDLGCIKYVTSSRKVSP